jgi:hypothetical protein
MLLRPQADGKIRSAVVVGDNRIVDVLRLNTGIHRGLKSAYTDPLSYQRTFTGTQPELVSFGKEIREELFCAPISPAGGPLFA